MALQFVRQLPRSWRLVSKPYRLYSAHSVHSRGVSPSPSAPLVLVLQAEISVTDHINAWLVQHNLERSLSGKLHKTTTMVLLKGLPANNTPIYETQLEDIGARHAPMTLGSARPFVYPWAPRKGMKPIGFEWFPSQQIQNFYREVAERFAQKIAITNEMKTLSGKDESPMEISRLCTPVVDVPLVIVDRTFDALDMAFPFGLDLGTSTEVLLVEKTTNHEPYKKYFQFSKGR